MSEKITLPCNAGALLIPKHREKIIRFRKRKLTMNNWQHRRKRMTLHRGERQPLLVAVKQRCNLIQMNRNVFLRAEAKPLDATALNRGSQIVYRAGYVGETKVNHRGNLSSSGIVAPHQVGAVPVIMCPEGRERRAIRSKTSVPWKKHPLKNGYRILFSKPGFEARTHG